MLNDLNACVAQIIYPACIVLIIIPNTTIFLILVTSAYTFGFVLANFLNNNISQNSKKQIKNKRLNIKHLSNKPPVGMIFSFAEPKI